MKEIFKILLIVITFITLIIGVLLLWVIYQFNYQKYNIEKIDISFFTNELENDLLKVVKVFQDTELRNIKIIDNKISYYNLNHNNLNEDLFLWFNVKENLEKNKINSAFYSINKNGEIRLIYFRLNYIDLAIVYRNQKENIKEWDIIWTWRVEKIINDNWFISKDCNRNICQEPQW